MKIGIIDVGGGLRDIYAAGVFDYCMDQHIRFDYCLGISAGSGNVVSYLAGQRGRNRQFYTEYALRPEYMGFSHFLRERSYINLPYLYGTLSNAGGENPLDYAALMANPAELLVSATNAQTGEATYFTKDDLRQDQYDILMASSCIPGINRPYMVAGVPYFDGALGDPVPVEKAFADGCDKVVLVLSKPADVPRERGKDAFLSRCIRRKYPQAAEQLYRRAEKYNAGVKAAKRYRQEGRALIVSPADTGGVSTLTRDKERLLKLYEAGFRDGEAIAAWLRP